MQQKESQRRIGREAIIPKPTDIVIKKKISSAKIPVRIDHKTIVLVSPDADIEAVKKKYLALLNPTF